MRPEAPASDQKIVTIDPLILAFVPTGLGLALGGAALYIASKARDVALVETGKVAAEVKAAATVAASELKKDLARSDDEKKAAVLLASEETRRQLAEASAGLDRLAAEMRSAVPAAMKAALSEWEVGFRDKLGNGLGKQITRELEARVESLEKRHDELRMALYGSGPQPKPMRRAI